MPGRVTYNPNESFASAQQALGRGDFSECLRLLDQLQQAVGTHPAIEHLKALALAGSNQRGLAKESFEKALELSRDQADPNILANFARLLWEDLQFQEAQKLLADAARLAPNDPAIQALNVTAIRRQSGDDAAQKAFRKLHLAQPNSPVLLHYECLFLRDAGQHQAALGAIEKALSLNSDSKNARHLKARLLADLGRSSSPDFADYCKMHPEDQDALCGWAASLFAEGDVDGALAQLDAAIEANPHFYGAIDTRLRMTTQAFSYVEAEAWIDRLVSERNNDAELARLHLQFLWRAAGAEKAQSRIAPLAENPSLLDLVQHAELLSTLGDIEGADTLFEKAKSTLIQAPAQLRMAEVRHNLRAGRIEQAGHMAHEIAKQTHLIEAWSYVECVWRILEDGRWNWLMDGGNLVCAFNLVGFEAYRDPLESDLRSLHARMKNQPYEQSVRGGTQTDGFLFGRAESSIRSLRGELEACVERYKNRIPALGPEHPLARLAGGHHRIVGSWSVLLQSSGHHDAHYHSEGLLSSACYIRLPESIKEKQDAKQQQGWIEFGRPPNDSGLNLGPFRTVKPEEGKLVLFPSFLFHGTRPFDDGERLTVAFDIADIRL